MASESTIQIEFKYSRAELRNAQCCRLCASGAEDSKESLSFQNIFESVITEPGVDKIEKPLDEVINRYLPLKVLSEDLYYPRLICKKCYDLLGQTIEFFLRIAAGQRILAKIINLLPVDAQKLSDTLELEFSDHNPVVQAPKRRGRPRKDPNKPKVSREALPVSVDDVKPKRVTKKPARYEAGLIEEDVVDTTPTDAAAVVEEHVANSLESATPAAPLVELTTTTACALYQENRPEFTSMPATSKLTEIPKLSVILCGDEELEVIDQGAERISDVQSVVPSEPPNLRKATEPLKEIEANVESMEKVLPPMAVPHKQLIDDIPDAGAANDSDCSVRTIDFKTKRKRMPRRNRRKKKLKNKKYKCAQCVREFPTSSSLSYHKKSSHSDKSYSCSICSKRFSHKQLLLNHSYVHSDQKMFPCPLCHLSFKSNSSLHTHKKSIHSRSTNYSCSECGFHFTLKSSLRAHLRLHTGEKPYSCDFCGKKFHQKSGYNEHRRTHTGEKPYKCEYPECEKAFKTRSQYRSHLMTHSPTKQYLCATCGRGFTHPDNFKSHMRRHATEKNYECQICTKRFIDEASLEKHTRQHNPAKILKCPTCGVLFNDKAAMERHLRSHSETDPISVASTFDFPAQITVEESSSRRMADSSTISAALNGAVDANIENSYVQIDMTGIGTGDEGQQVIFLYSDDLSYYTLSTLDAQGQEVTDTTVRPTVSEEVAPVTSPITFAAVDPDIAAQYFSIGTLAVSDTTNSSVAPVVESSIPMIQDADLPAVTASTATDETTTFTTE